MAARTGASIGVAVTITILGLLSLAFFITTMVFFGQAQDAKKRARDAETAAETFVRGPERDSERVRAVRELANRDRQSVTAYLITALRDSMQLAAGNPDLTIDEFKTRVAEVEGSDANSLLGVIGVRNDRIAALQDELAQSDSARQAAVDRAQEEAARADALAGEFRDAGDQLRTKVDDYGQIVQTYSTGVDSIEERFKAELDAAKQAADERERDLRARLQEFTNANLVLQDQLSRLRGEGAVDRVRPRAEEALVDATIDQVVPTDNEVVLGIGRNQKVVLGMTFAVYSSPTDIRIDPETGEYAPGKGAVEIVGVEDNFSRARIIEEARGNPIVRGDVVANAVYDPNKEYKFIVYGLFDFNSDGRKTAFERDQVQALISRWGGTVVDDIQGDLDFLVLGEKPTLGPPPPPNATIPEIQEYARLQRIVARYDELLEAAQSTSVPVLNENRLTTLIGRYPD
jgi:hypothetical protein